MTIGLIPCAGSATRIQGLPKYLLPVGDDYLLSRLISSMQEITPSILIGVNPENAGIVGQYKKSAMLHTAKNYKTMSETVLSCRQFFQLDEITLFGMPDTFTEDDGLYIKLQSALNDGADIAVALFCARPHQHLKAGMCDTRGNRVVTVIDKPTETTFTRLWGALAWQPVFWQYIQSEDPHVGYALPRAIAAGLDVRAVRMDGQYFDCGTTAEYFDLVTHLHGRKEAVEMQQVYG